LFFFFGSICAQVSDSFSNPKSLKNGLWYGDTAFFTIENGKLISKGSGSKTAFLLLKSNLENVQNWRVDFELNFNPSSANYVDFILASDCPNLDIANAYFLRLGGSNDAITLYHLKKGLEEKLQSWYAGFFDQSRSLFSLEIEKNDFNTWNLWIDSTQNRSHKILLASFAKNFDVEPFFTGFSIKSTSTRWGKHLIDNFFVLGEARTQKRKPRVFASHWRGKNEIDVFFDQSVSFDSLTHNDFQLTKNHKILSFPDQISHLEPQRINLSFTDSWDFGDIMHLKISGVQNFYNQGLDTTIRHRFPRLPDAGDLIINEILYDPGEFLYEGKTYDGVEFLEIVNVSEDTFDLGQIGLDFLGKKQELSDALILPHQIIAFSEDSTLTKKQFGTAQNQTLMQLDLMQALSNDGGNLFIYNRQDSTVLDHVGYHPSMHFELLKTTKGVSLERKNPYWPGKDFDNWASASAAQHFGTPGYANSQHINGLKVFSKLLFSNENRIITPNGDGHFDVLTLEINFEKSGFLLNSSIYDSFGRKIKTIASNQYCSAREIQSWDGLTNQSQKAPVGNYVWLIEAHHPEGNSWLEKFRVTLLNNP